MVNSIIFVCAYNKTRSQVAEHLFNKQNKNKNWKAISAGVFGGKYKKDLDLTVVLKKYKAKIGKVKTLDRNLLPKQKIIILVADDIPKDLFKGYEKRGIKVLQWSVKDGWARSGKTRVERLDQVYLDINKRIKSFVREFNEKI